MTKFDLKILTELAKGGYTTELKSCTVSQMVEKVERSYSKVYGNLTNLTTGGYVAKGLKSSHADTYYITAKGLEHLGRYSK